MCIRFSRGCIHRYRGENVVIFVDSGFRLIFHRVEKRTGLDTPGINENDGISSTAASTAATLPAN